MDDWIKPGESVTSVEKKINKSDHPGAESDSEDNDDDSDNDDDENTTKEEEKKIGPLEMDETDNKQSQKIDEKDNQQLQTMDVDDIKVLPEINETTNVLGQDETMEED